MSTIVNGNVGETEDCLLPGEPIKRLLEDLKINQSGKLPKRIESSQGSKTADESSQKAADAALCNVIEAREVDSKPELMRTKSCPALKSNSWSKKMRQTAIWGSWCQPRVADVLVRSKTYLYSKMKIPHATPPLLKLVHSDLIHSESRFDNIASHEKSWLNRVRPEELSGRKFFVINIQLYSMSCSLVQYFMFDESGLTGCERVDKMWEDFVRGTDKFRDQRLKLIPVIVNGPWMVKTTVPEKPCIIGTKVNHRYWEGENYFEVDIEADSSMLAIGILKLLKNYNNYSVNLIWLLEAKLTSELPEKILAAGHIAYPVYRKAIRLENMRS